MAGELVGYESLSADINKNKGTQNEETREGVVSEKLPELTLEMSNEDLLKLTKKWEKMWKESPAKAEWEKQIKENEKYWLGQQFDSPKADKTRPMVDNLIFESLETYLPQATRRNPEPIVTLDNIEETSPANEKYVEKLKNRLADLADKNKIRLKLKKAARHWGIYHLGVAKMGWDLDRDIPLVRIVRPQKIILDPEATIDEDGYTGNRIGEYRKMEANRLLSIMGEKPEPEAVKAVKELVKDDTGTEVSFVEWWTPEYMCWKLGEHILLKRKNPHWNYDETIEDEAVDEYGNGTPTNEEKLGNNHFASPEMPYCFLSVFNLGDQPMDKTSLIQQNLSNQDLINKRNRQIDKNADSMNNGMVVSMGRSGLTKEQSSGVTEALRKGGTVVIPDGSPRDAIDRFPANPLPADVFNQLMDIRARTRDIFGVAGSSQAGLSDEQTVRGKIISRGLDTDRIGGGVTEYLEQFADDIYNWFVQLLYVYDTGFQFIEGAVPPKVVVSVKEGSLLPKDSTSLANQALELAGMGKIANIDLYKRLEYPNPEELAANVWLETNAPHLLYRDNPLVMEALQMQQMQAQQEQEMQQEQQFKNDEEKHGREIEKEAMKSILSEVPQANA